MFAVPVPPPDSTTSGYRVPCTRYFTVSPCACASATTSAAACSNTRMNSRPMILRFSSGSVTPASASRNRLRASTTTSATSVAATKSRSTCSGSPSRSSPWSTNTQVSRSPTARCTRAAATAESTPPDSPQITRWSPTWARIAATCSSMTFAVVQVRRHPARSNRKCSSSCWPCSVCSTSGWNWTPASRRPASSKAATGAPAVVAQTVNPGGAAATESPCDIHTDSCSGRPANSRTAGSVTVSGVRPNSDRPVRSTVPPSAWAIAWNP